MPVENRNRLGGYATSRAINSVLRPDCLVAARDPNVMEQKSDGSRIFLSDGALSDNRTEAGGWIFSRSGNGYLAFRVAGDQGFSVEESVIKAGWEYAPKDVWAPMVVQMGQAKNHESFEAFIKAVQAQPFTYADGKLTYTTLAGDTIEYWSKSNRIPHVNAEEFKHQSLAALHAGLADRAALGALWSPKDAR